MSPLQNGSEIPDHSLIFPVEDISQVGEVRRHCQHLSSLLGFDDVRQGQVGIIINELGNNLVKYSQSGKLILRACKHKTYSELEIIAIDKGPGIADTDRVMKDGFTTGQTPGTGLGAVRRLAKVFDIYSYPGRGTVILATISNEVAPSAFTEKNNFSFGAVNTPIKGETTSGDAWSIKLNKDSFSLISVDGLGHGPIAHKAAMEAVDSFDATDTNGVENKLKIIHNRLKSTRGAAVFLVEGKLGQDLTYAGVGNIRAFVQAHGRQKNLISQNGTAGLQMRITKPMSQDWDYSGFLVLHSDGISSHWELGNYVGITSHHPSILAAMIHRDYIRGTDDASVVVIGAKK